MNDKYDPNEVKRFWTEQAGLHGQSSDASWSDRSVIEMEIAEIGRHLRDGDRVLDVGCANGYSTVRFAAQHDLTIRGVDYIPEMIRHAGVRAADLDEPVRSRVEFAVGNILELNEPDSAYDAVVVVRVLINLSTWENQQRAIGELARVLKPGGRLMLSEATVQGWERLNAFRREWKLKDIPMPPFNQYLDEGQVIEAAGAMSLDLVDVVNFASTYYVGSRIIKPLLDQALHGILNVADPNAEWNRFWSALPAAGDYGTQKLFLFAKR